LFELSGPSVNDDDPRAEGSQHARAGSAGDADAGNAHREVMPWRIVTR
jgi:hypothetical protein